MLDRRQSARDEVIYGGVAEIDERGTTTDCVVRNISEQGASLEFSSAVRLPKGRLSLTIAQKVDRVIGRVVIDMRGVASLEPEEQAIRLESFLQRTTLAARFMVGAVTAPTERTRRIGVWPDAYYLSSQQGYNGGALNAVAFDRTRMA